MLKCEKTSSSFFYFYSRTDEACFAQKVFFPADLIIFHRLLVVHTIYTSNVHKGRHVPTQEYLYVSCLTIVNLSKDGGFFLSRCPRVTGWTKTPLFNLRGAQKN